MEKLFGRLAARCFGVRDGVAKSLAALPCLALAAGVVNGAVWTLKFDALSLPELTALSLPGLLLAALLLKRGPLTGFALCTLLGLLSAQLNEIVPASDYTRVIGGRAACGATVEARVVDESCCGERLAWLPNPKYVKMEALRVKLSAQEEWTPVSGLFATRLPEQFKPEYGAHVRLEGAFQTLERPAAEGSFDFNRYLQLRSVRRVFDAQGVEGLSQEGGFMHAIFAFREKALEKLCEGIAGDDSKRLVAALVFGCQQGVSWDDRTAFLKSGTIHILSVSGLHIAMAAAFFALALRLLPFRPRHLLLPLLTLLYALSTGMQAPSFRAFAMLATWSLLRAALLSTNAMNSTLLAAFLLLLWSPAQMLDPGFQYSFLCVLFLLGSASAVGEWRACAVERRRWVPLSFANPFGRWRQKAVEWLWLSLAGCLVAWLASCGLSMLYQGLGVPFSIPTNMLLIPITWGIFGLFALQGLFFWLPGFVAMTGPPMEWLLEAMNAVCRLFASYGGGCAPMPPGWSVALFLLLLALTLAARGKAATLCLAGALTLALSAWLCWGVFEKPELAILRGGPSQEPMIVASDPASGVALAINAPDFDASRQMSAYLASRGQNNLDALIVSAAPKVYCGGALSLLSMPRVEELLIPKPSPLAATALSVIEAARQRGISTRVLEAEDGTFFHSSSLFLAALGKRGFRVECRAPSLNIVIVGGELSPGVRRIAALAPDGSVLAESVFANSLERKLELRSLVRK